MSTVGGGQSKSARRRQRAKAKAVKAFAALPNGSRRKTVPLNVTISPDQRLTVSGRGKYVRNPTRQPVSGKGKYFADDYFKRLGKTFAGDYGEVVGEGVGSILNAFGLGDYEVVSNSLLQPGAMVMRGQQVPRISNSPGGEVVRIRKEEYVGDLYSATGTPTVFSLDTFNINPANPALFPWLSVVANNFEEYEFNGLIITLKTMSSDVSTATSLGTMFGATQYDINDPVFTNKQELLNYYFANSVKISDSVMLPVECERKQNVLNHLYVATGNVIPPGADSKFYNLGNLSIGSFGCPAANTPIAEIWVSYDIDLFKPKLALGGELQLGTFSGQWTSTGGLWSNSSPLNGLTANPGNNFPGSISGTMINFPAFMSEGVFLCYFNWAGSVATGVTSPTYTGTNCSLVSSWSASASSSQAPFNTTSATRLGTAIIVTLTGTGAYITLSGMTGPGTPTNSDLVVTQINGAL